MLDDDGRYPPRTKRKLPPYTHTKIQTCPLFCAATLTTKESPLGPAASSSNASPAQRGPRREVSRSFPLGVSQVRGLDDYSNSLFPLNDPTSLVGDQARTGREAAGLRPTDKLHFTEMPDDQDARAALREALRERKATTPKGLWEPGRAYPHHSPRTGS